MPARSSRRLLYVLAGVAWLMHSGMTAAHESLPVYVELRQVDARDYVLEWKSPYSIPYANAPSVAVSGACEVRSKLAEARTPDGLIRRQAYECIREPSGASLEITYSLASPAISALVRFEAVNGERYVGILGPGETSWIIPSTESLIEVAASYLRLGIQHILMGSDHLLFLIGLLWIAKTPRRIALTVTGFTIAHSLTLALSALDIVRLAVPPVEATIALSIMFLARELAKGETDSLTWRNPVAVSTTFGLLHGFGFASVLREIGLPQVEVATGLLFFNVGVEVGQLLVAGAVMSLYLVAKRNLGSLLTANTRAVRAAGVATVWGLGGVASFWFIQRCAQF